MASPKKSSEKQPFASSRNDPRASPKPDIIATGPDNTAPVSGKPYMSEGEVKKVHGNQNTRPRSNSTEAIIKWMQDNYPDKLKTYTTIDHDSPKEGDSSHSDFLDLQSKHNTLKKEFKEEQGRHVRTRSQVEASKIVAQQGEETKNTMVTQQYQISELKQKLDAASEENTRIHNEHAHTQSKFSAAHKKIETLERTLGDQEKKFQAQINYVEKADEECAELKKTHVQETKHMENKMERENKRHNDIHGKLQEQIEGHESEQKQLRDLFNGFQSSMGRRASISDSVSLKKLLQEYFQDFKTLLHGHEQLMADHESLQVSNNSLLKESQEKKDKAEASKSEVQHRKSLEPNDNEPRTSDEQNTKDIQGLKQKADDLAKANKILKAKLTTTREESLKRQVKLDENQVEIEDLVRQLGSSGQQDEEPATDVPRLTIKNVESGRDQNGDISFEMSQYKATIDALKQKCSEVESERDQLQTHVDQAAEASLRLHTAREIENGLKGRDQELLQTIAKLSRAVEEPSPRASGGIVQQRVAKLEEVEKSNTELKATVTVLNNRIQDAYELVRQKTLQVEDHEKDYEDEREQLNGRLEQADSNVRNLQDELERSGCRIEDLERQVSGQTQHQPSFGSVNTQTQQQPSFGSGNFQAQEQPSSGAVSGQNLPNPFVRTAPAQTYHQPSVGQNSGHTAPQQISDPVASGPFASPAEPSDTLHVRKRRGNNSNEAPSSWNITPHPAISTTMQERPPLFAGGIVGFGDIDVTLSPSHLRVRTGRAVTEQNFSSSRHFQTGRVWEPSTEPTEQIQQAISCIKMQHDTAGEARAAARKEIEAGSGEIIHHGHASQVYAKPSTCSITSPHNPYHYPVLICGVFLATIFIWGMLEMILDTSDTDSHGSDLKYYSHAYYHPRNYEYREPWYQKLFLYFLRGDMEPPRAIPYNG